MRRLFPICAVVTFAISMAFAAHAQPFPSRTISLVVGVSAGSVTDIIARILAEAIGRSMRQPTIVENRPGAGGALAAESIARTSPTGHDLLLSSVRVQYRLDKGLTPVAMVAKSPLVLFASSTGPTSAVELISRAKSKRASISIAYTDLLGLLAISQLEAASEIAFQSIHYREDPKAIQALTTGEAVGLLASYRVAAGAALDKSIKPLAVASKQRSTLLPDVPTLAELNLGDISIDEWVAVLAPAGTPREVVAQLNAAIVGALNDPSVTSKLAGLGVVPSPSSPAAFAASVASSGGTPTCDKQCPKACNKCTPHNDQQCCSDRFEPAN
jgi:tripartite-type tricarboxylate transporter receptor subunit TctC